MNSNTAHSHNHSQNTDYNKAFAFGIALNIIYVVVEFSYGLAINSMALIADASHNLSNILGLVLAWIASYLAKNSYKDKNLRITKINNIRCII